MIIKEALRIIKEHDNDTSFNKPLDIAVLDKKGYGRPWHLKELESNLVSAWTNKESMAASMPSRWGKTDTVSYFIAWLLMDYPELKIIWSGYNEKISKRSVSNVRRILERFNPNILNKKKSTESYFETIEGGYVLAASPTGSQTGYGAHIIVIDDLIKGFEESLSDTIQEKHRDYWDSTLSQRLEPFILDDIQYEGLVFAIGTIWGPDDLLNKFHDDFTSFKLPALNNEGLSNWPDKYSTKNLLKQKSTHSSYFWEAMFMCSPVKRGGNLFKKDWLNGFDVLYAKDYIRTGLFVDPAVSTKKGADETAVLFCVWAFNKLYAMKLWHYKRSVFQNIDFLEGLYHELMPDMFVIENVGFADSLVEGLGERNIPVNGYHPGRVQKEVRIINQLEARLENGLILFDDSVKNDETFLSQYSRFPRSSHDDILDVLAIAAELFFKKSGGGEYTKSKHRYQFSSSRESVREWRQGRNPLMKPKGLYD